MDDQRQPIEMHESSRCIPTAEKLGFHHSRSLRTVRRPAPLSFALTLPIPPSQVQVLPRRRHEFALDDPIRARAAKMVRSSTIEGVPLLRPKQSPHR